MSRSWTAAAAINIDIANKVGLAAESDRLLHMFGWDVNGSSQVIRGRSRSVTHSAGRSLYIPFE